jgi:hypothetical protein
MNANNQIFVEKSRGTLLGSAQTFGLCMSALMFIFIIALLILLSCNVRLSLDNRRQTLILIAEMNQTRLIHPTVGPTVKCL